MPECGPGPGVEGGARPQRHERRHREQRVTDRTSIDRVEPWQQGTQRRIDDPHGPGDQRIAGMGRVSGGTAHERHGHHHGDGTERQTDA
jgi:hypothetical protein